MGQNLSCVSQESSKRRIRRRKSCRLNTKKKTWKGSSNGIVNYKKTIYIYIDIINKKTYIKKQNSHLILVKWQKQLKFILDI